MGRTAELWSRERWQAAQVLSEADLLSFKNAISEQLRL
jgi:MraZ protein